MRLLRAIPGLSCVMLSACVSYPGYPSDWAPMQSAQPDCFAIAGIYENWGTGGRVGRAQLAPRLTRNMKLLDAGIGAVEIAVTREGRLDVTPRPAAPGQAKQFFADKGEYRCVDGKIQIPYVETQTAEKSAAIAMYVAKGTLTLARATDGALVLEDSGVAMGLVFLIIPAPIAASEWTRYLRRAPGQ